LPVQSDSWPDPARITCLGFVSFPEHHALRKIRCVSLVTFPVGPSWRILARLTAQCAVNRPRHRVRAANNGTKCRYWPSSGRPRGFLPPLTARRAVNLPRHRVRAGNNGTKCRYWPSPNGSLGAGRPFSPFSASRVRLTMTSTSAIATSTNNTLPNHAPVFGPEQPGHEEPQPGAGEQRAGHERLPVPDVPPGATRHAPHDIPGRNEQKHAADQSRPAFLRTGNEPAGRKKGTQSDQPGAHPVAGGGDVGPGSDRSRGRFRSAAPPDGKSRGDQQSRDDSRAGKLPRLRQKPVLRVNERKYGDAPDPVQDGGRRPPCFPTTLSDLRPISPS